MLRPSFSTNGTSTPWIWTTRQPASGARPNPPRWLTVSALTGRGIERVLPLARERTGFTAAASPQPSSNCWLNELRAKRLPAAKKGKTIKTFYMTQYEVSPPRFKVMVNARHWSTNRSPISSENPPARGLPDVGYSSGD